MPIKDKEKRREYHAGYWKEYYSDPERKRRHIQSVRKNEAKRNKALQAWVSNYKMEKGCQVCGFKEHPSALEFHHLVASEKSFDISTMCHRSIGVGKLRREIAKCVVLCSNHHHMVTFGALVLP